MNNVEQLYNSYLEFSDQMTKEHSIYAIAGVMLAQALSIYKTTLSQDDYNNMIDKVSDSRDQVKTFDFDRRLQ